MGNTNKKLFEETPVPAAVRTLMVPTIIGALVTVLYSLADTLFVGMMNDEIQNAAVALAAPALLAFNAVNNLFGVGSSSMMSRALGRGDTQTVRESASFGFYGAVASGAVLSLLCLIFIHPFVALLGGDGNTTEATISYMRWAVVCGAIPTILNVVMGYMVRSEGAALHASIGTMSGCVLNIILDPIFIFGLQMGMRGAALATIIGQIVSFCISLRYMFHFKTIRLTKESFHMTGRHIENIFKFGASACFNQIAMTIVQIVLNNTLSHYGAQSVYGGDIPLACAGIITKVNMIFMSFVIGISQGIQPIIGFNYGAEKYERVRKSYLLALGTATVLSGIAFFCFQVFPRQIISVFGSGSELYFQFSERYFRIYMFLTLINGIQPVTSNFFNSIGKSQLGVFMSLTRQILFLLPLIVIFPLFMGIDGVMYAGPIADAAAAIVCGYFMVRELKELSAMDRKKKEEYAA